jgi:hypothetical protein
LISFCRRVYSCSIPYLSSQEQQGQLVNQLSSQNSYTIHSKCWDNFYSNTIPWLLGRNSRVAEDLGSVVSLVGGDWLASWGVAIAHDLQVGRI